MNDAVADLIDHVRPGYHWLAVAMTVIVIPVLLWLVGFRFQLKTERREASETFASLTGKLLDLQRAELTRLVSESEGLHRQVDLLATGRLRLQDALNAVRDQVVAARVLVHDYERRLGLPETSFPPLPTPTLVDPKLAFKVLSDAN